jgi:hypothetical protein
MEKKTTDRGGAGIVGEARMNVGRMKVMSECETADRRTLDCASARGEHH